MDVLPKLMLTLSASLSSRLFSVLLAVCLVKVASLVQSNVKMFQELQAYQAPDHNQQRVAKLVSCSCILECFPALEFPKPVFSAVVTVWSRRAFKMIYGVGKDTMSSTSICTKFMVEEAKCPLPPCSLLGCHSPLLITF